MKRLSSPYSPRFSVACIFAQSPDKHELPGDRPAPNVHATRSVVMGRNGMIATSQPLASAAGLKVLQDGGNAIDAAVTAAAVLAVVEPSMTGIGGDLFAIVYDAKTKTLHALNASGRSAYAATPEAYARRGQTTDARRGRADRHGSRRGRGMVGAAVEVSARCRWRKAVAPAIGYAKNGYAVSEIISGQWKASEKKLAGDPTTAATFLPNGHPPVPGRDFRQPASRGLARADCKGRTRRVLQRARSRAPSSPT